MKPPGKQYENASSGAEATSGTLVARDGRTFHYRAIHPDDAPRLQNFHQRLSHRSLIFRFFGEMPELGSALAERLSHVDYEDRMAIVATPGDDPDEPIIAVARYERAEPWAAEFALAVEDRLQGQNIGPQLLLVLAHYARQRGITELIANVMYDNDRMQAMLRHLPVPSVHHLLEGRVEVRLDISSLPAQRETDLGR
ncbi:MAG TPA: GNAT family N-acetyltransferase [Ktedonobacterales bacterium]